MEQAEELRKVLEEASQGNWMPLTIIVFLFAIVSAIGLYAIKNVIKKNEEDHNELKDNYITLESIMDKAMDNQKDLGLMSREFGIKIEHIEVQVQENKEDIKEIRNAG